LTIENAWSIGVKAGDWGSGKSTTYPLGEVVLVEQVVELEEDRVPRSRQCGHAGEDMLGG
jgi:hypothetical protein